MVQTALPWLHHVQQVYVIYTNKYVPKKLFKTIFSLSDEVKEMLDGYRNYIATQGVSSAYVGEDEFNSRTESLLQDLTKRREKKYTQGRAWEKTTDNNSIYEIARDVQELRYDVKKMERTLENSKIMLRTEMDTVRRELEEKLTKLIHKNVDEGLARVAKVQQYEAPLPPPHKETFISSEVSNLRMKVIEQEMASLSQRVTDVTSGIHLKSSRPNVLFNNPHTDLSAVVDLLQQQINSSKSSLQNAYETTTRHTDNDISSHPIRSEPSADNVRCSSSDYSRPFVASNSKEKKSSPTEDDNNLPGFSDFCIGSEPHEDIVDVTEQINLLRRQSQKPSQSSKEEESVNLSPQVLNLESSNVSLNEQPSGILSTDQRYKNNSQSDVRRSSKSSSKKSDSPGSRASSGVSNNSPAQSSSLPVLKKRFSLSSSNDSPLQRPVMKSGSSSSPTELRKASLSSSRSSTQAIRRHSNKSDSPPLLQSLAVGEALQSLSERDQQPDSPTAIKSNDSTQSEEGNKLQSSFIIKTDTPVSEASGTSLLKLESKGDREEAATKDLAPDQTVEEYDEYADHHLLADVSVQKKLSDSSSSEEKAFEAAPKEQVLVPELLPQTQTVEEFDEYADHHLLADVSVQKKLSDSSSSEEAPVVRRRKPARGARKLNFLGGGSSSKGPSKPPSRTNKMLFSETTEILPEMQYGEPSKDIITTDSERGLEIGKVSSTLETPIVKNIKSKIFESDSEGISEGTTAVKPSVVSQDFDDDFDFDELNEAPQVAKPVQEEAAPVTATTTTTTTTTTFKAAATRDFDDFDEEDQSPVKPATKQAPRDPFGEDSDFDDNNYGYTGGNAWGGL